MKLTNEQKQRLSINNLKIKQKELHPGTRKILYERSSALDPVFTGVVDYMGDDTSIVQSARGIQRNKKVSTDEGLIKYLMRHWHSTL